LEAAVQDREVERPIVCFEDLRKSFGALEVLNGVSFATRTGEVVSILGSSGSGKSTMLRCLNLLETPDSGAITVGPERLSFGRGGEGRPDRRQVDRLRRATGMVYQSFNLWSHMTILENVMEAPIHVLKRPRAECVAEAEALLAKVGLAERRYAYPAHLSGGPAAARGYRPRLGRASPRSAVRRADRGAGSRTRWRGAASHAVAR
jgi:octopine/nopaline transport system ATP-binding protein